VGRLGGSGDIFSIPYFFGREKKKKGCSSLRVPSLQGFSTNILGSKERKKKREKFEFFVKPKEGGHRRGACDLGAKSHKSTPSHKKQGGKIGNSPGQTAPRVSQVKEK